MAELKHRVVLANGIRIHLVEAGKGPLVLMVHDFPESWYSWRHQLHALPTPAIAPSRLMYVVTGGHRHRAPSTSTG